MGRPLDTNDDIAIAQLVLYVFLLGGAIVLNIKHGFSKSAGWRYLAILALARIIGSSLLLATIADPTNTSLYIGWMTLNGVGLGPLVLTLLGMVGRLFDSINRQGRVIVEARYRRIIDLLMLVGMILLIIGGTKSSYTMVDGNPKVDYSTESHVGMGIMIAVFVLLILEVLLAFGNQGFIAQGEHRLLFAVIVSLPFVAIRLVYSSILTFGGKASNVWFYLGASVIMELIVVCICEIVGFSLAKAPRAENVEGEPMDGRMKGRMGQANA